MYSDGVVYLALGVMFVWILVLSFYVFQIRSFLFKLFPEEGGNFHKKLTEVLRGFESLEEFKSKSKTFTQRVSLKRYNPYRDTGGDQSFTVAFLDEVGDGLVITSLHSRSGTRVFAKQVKSGKEGGTEFSEEEKEVVKQAMLVG